MNYLGKWIGNIAIILVILFVVFILSPTIMGEVFKFQWMLLGPILIMVVLVIALPRRRRK